MTLRRTLGLWQVSLTGVGVILGAGVYVAVALSATAVVRPEALGASSAPLALVVGTVLGGGADLVITLMALAATANTVLLLLVSGSRSVYGMATAGVLPGRLARLTTTRVPREAMIVVLLVALGLVAVGDLSRAAHLTDAVVLLSFICVNLGLTWLGIRKRTHAAATTRTLDVVVSGAGALMCAWPRWHGGWVWILAAGGVGLLGAVALIAGRAAAGASARRLAASASRKGRTT